MEHITGAIVFANAALLISLGMIIVTGAVVIINNIFHRFWKPIRIFWPIEHPSEIVNKVKKEPTK